MGDSLTQVIAWRSVVPITMGVMAIALVNWLSNYWAQMTAQRTARVVSRMNARRVYRR